MDASWSGAQIEILRPAWLGALLVLPLVVYWWRRGLTPFAARRRGATLICRVLLLATLALALADLRLVAPPGPQTPAVAQDNAPSPTDGVPEVWVSEVRAPGVVREGEPFSVEAVIQSCHDDSGSVELVGGAQTLQRRPVKLVPGENRMRIVHAIVGARAATLVARLRGFRDTLSENNAAGAVVLVASKPRVLVVEGEPQAGRHLAEAFRSHQIDADLRSADALAHAPGPWDDYALLVLANVPAAAIPRAAMEAMRSYVRDSGGGLIVVGGERAFTAGGYRNTPLDDLLPVRSVFDKKEPRPGLGLVLVIDRSLSMKGAAMELVKEATRRAVEMLDAQDQVGVLAFDDASEWVVPLGPASDKAGVLERIGRIEAQGRTNMSPAMEKAHLALDEAFAPRKHMIVFTDGISQPGDFEGVARRIAQSGITISTVAAGREVARLLLEDIARLGQGKSYHCDDMADVPTVFALEVAGATRLGIIERPSSARRVRAASALAGVDLAHAPALLGYVGTEPKPTSQVILASESGDPLLVWWRYGLGVCAAFTSDAQARWAAAWLRWPGFSRFWAQWARHAMRRDRAGDFGLRLQRRQGRAIVTLEALDPQGEFVNGAAGTMTVVAPRQPGRHVPLVQTAPGRYAAGFAAADCGTYYVEVELRHEGRRVFAERRGLVVSYADTFLPRPVHPGAPEFVAATTGEKDKSHHATLQATPRLAPARTIDTWPCLVLAGAAMLVIDVALRRQRPLSRRPEGGQG